jgi:2-dehydropantoate 2-reductase
MIRLGVVGMGAIGGWVAGFLGHRLGADAVRVSAYARGATRDALRAHGLRLDSGGERIVVPVHASDRIDDLGPQDLLVLAVKGPSLREVAPVVEDWLATCDADARVLVAMNGVPWWFFERLDGPCAGLHLDAVDPGGDIARRIPVDRVIGSVVHASCAVDAPGHVRHVMGMGLILGEPAGGVSPALQRIAEPFSRAGFNLTLSPRIQNDLWYKLWGNMTMNPISALTGATTDRILDDELVREFVSAVMREASAIGARIGCPIEQTPEQRHAVTRKLGAFRTSMLQDADAGRRLELDALVGAVSEIGRRVDVPTPHTDALLGLTRLMANVRGLG